MSNFSLMPWAPSQWTDSLGNILEFGIIRFYQAGTLIPKPTYKKADGSEANENPLVLDSAARARVWLINGEAYDIVVHNKNDEFEYSILDVVASGGGSDEDTGKVRVYTGDTLEFLGIKIAPGTGIVFNVTVDDVNGAVIHASATDEPGADDHKVAVNIDDTVPGYLQTKLVAGDGINIEVVDHLTLGKLLRLTGLVAPSTEVVVGTGTGASSSPAFTAVGGDVGVSTLQANAPGEAVTAPNGSILARGIAQADRSAWGGAGMAWFGPKGHNPPTDDGTLSGLMVGSAAMLRAEHGSSAGIGTGLGNFAVYDNQAAADVPVTAPAFHQLDAAILTGISYAATYHATICFFGTGTAFVVPAGSSLNRTIRLSNSSAASIAITGVAMPFSLEPGTSRDLFWSDEIIPRWY